MTMGATERLAEFASTLRLADIPPECCARARMFLLDALGIMLGAVEFTRREGLAELAAYLGLSHAAGSATLVGLGKSASPLTAAFFNGALSELLDCQDTNLAARIHNGTAVIPVALALAEERALPGQEIATAIIAGYEVGSRLSLAIQPQHWHRGFQATGTFGTSGAAASAGRLLQFDSITMRHCLGISGFIMPVSNSDNFFRGYSIKPVHGGQAAQVALQSAYLAQAGFQAGPLEGEPPRYHGVLRTLSDGNPDLRCCTDDLGIVWHSMEVAFKPYPVGLLNVGAIQLCLSLRREAGFQLAQIDRVDVSTYKEAAIFTGQKYTTVHSSFIDCHLSLPFCVAISLMDGELTPRQLLHSRTRDPMIHDLARRVNVREDAAMSERYPHAWPVEVAIRLRDGQVLKAAIEEVDWSPRRPPSWEQLAEKFVIMSEPVIGRAAAHRVIELTGGLERIDDIRSVTTLLGTK